MVGFEAMIGFLIALVLAFVGAHVLSSEARLPAETLQALRQANEHEQLLEVHRRQPDPAPVDDRRWRAAQQEIDHLIRQSELDERPRVQSPRGELQGEVPPLYLFAELSLEGFAEATVRGMGDPAMAWRTPRPRWSGEGIIVRILANSAFLHGVRFDRRPEGWILSTLPPEFVDREWTFANHRLALGGGGLVTGRGH